MKKIKFILIIVVFGITTGLVAQQKKATISFNNLTHDFGTIKEEDGKVSCTFEFTNTGSIPLVINRVAASCGCTSPSWSREPIIPGGKGYIEATYNPKHRPGKFSKSLTVFSNAAKRAVVLRIKGEVTPKKLTIVDKYPYKISDIRFKSNHLAFVKINQGETKTIQMQIINTSDEVQSLSFEQVPKHIKLKAVPEKLKPKQEGYIEATYDAGMKNDWGFLISRIRVLVNDKAIGNNRLTVSATIIEDFSSMSPAELAKAAKIEFPEGKKYDFGKIAQRTKVEHEYVFKNSGKSELVLRKIKSSCGCTAVSPKDRTIEPGESSSIKAIFSAGTRHGRQNKSITLITNDPKNSRIILRLSGEVSNETR